MRKVLDLFCGGGGVSQGYADAGFAPVGVDKALQPNYPFEFIQGDALDVLRDKDFLNAFDFIHASPECYAHSRLAAIWKARWGADVWAEKHPDQVPETRRLLIASGKPYIIENVARKPLVNPFMLCGTFFNLKVYRHRFFESNIFLLAPQHVPHRDNCPAVGRGKSNKGFISVTGHGGFGFQGGTAYAKKAMGIDWMSRKELSLAIPPAYTQWIGERVKKIL